MIYLFSQIAISLALAAIVGGAAGWLAHRARAGKQIKQLGVLISRQQQQVSEAQTQVSLLTDDFDDLKHHSETEISGLKLENKKIPALNQNLEKSQLLVRQLLQQHKTESAEITAENEMLTAKAKLVNDREQAITKLQAELDIERRRNQQLNSDSDESVSKKTQTADQPTLSTDAKSEKPVTDEAGKKSNSSDPSNTEKSAKPTTVKSVEKSDSTSSDSVKNEDESPTSVAPKKSTKATAKQNELSASNTGKNQNSSKDNAEQASEPTAAMTPSAAQTEVELKLLRDQLAEDIPRTEPAITSHSNSVERKDNQNEPNAEDNELEPLFDAVAQHDDLKQIFGIGPVTEKTLNKLGITAYSQLAELKQHDIEKIADALQIFPGRIERDNWVGGARAQLEEVLENL